MTQRLNIRGLEASGLVGDGAQALHDDGTWKIPAGGSGGATVLDDLTDVDTTTTPPTSGDALLYDGTSWAPGAVGGGGGGSAGRVLISKVALASAGPTISFPSIPTTYEHLELCIMGRSSSGSTSVDTVTVTVNGDTTDANYSYKFFYGSTAAGFNAGSARQAMFMGSSGIGILTTPAIGTLRLLNYQNTAWFKTLMSQYHTPIQSSTATGNGALTWKGTAAVTSLSLGLTTGPNFLAGSTAWLYGLT